MTLAELGSLGEFVGAIGVVATLVYLAYQIRQNTHQLEQSTLTAKAAAINASNIAIRHTRQSVYQSSEMTEIFLRGNQEPDRLSAADALR